MRQRQVEHQRYSEFSLCRLLFLIGRPLTEINASPSAALHRLANMPQSTAKIRLLEEAKGKRAEAERARRLARTVGKDDVVAVRLRNYADELEHQAHELEERAVDIN
jgi:hypothetical protein